MTIPPITESRPAIEVLQDLVKAFLTERHSDRPLGLMVFGQSRRVISLYLDELFKSIPGSNGLRRFEIDLSVFTHESQLIDFFSLLETHTTNGEPLICVIHNFDSQDGRWLIFFLAPLENGGFANEHSDRCKLGRCIFIFSTATTTKFADFSHAEESVTSPKHRVFSQHKGPDFVSRISGHVDDVRPRNDDTSENRVGNAIRTMSERLALEIAYDPDALMHIHDRHLEEVLSEALDGIGFAVELGPGTKDGGKDIVVIDRETKKKYLVEIKHWRSGKRVKGNMISDFVKVVARENAAKGLFVSSSGFAPDAFEVVSEVHRKKVHLGGRDKIVHLCSTFANCRSGIVVPASEMTRVLFMETA